MSTRSSDTKEVVADRISDAGQPDSRSGFEEEDLNDELLLKFNITLSGIRHSISRLGHETLAAMDAEVIVSRITTNEHRPVQDLLVDALSSTLVSHRARPDKLVNAHILANDFADEARKLFMRSLDKPVVENGSTAGTVEVKQEYDPLGELAEELGKALHLTGDQIAQEIGKLRSSLKSLGENPSSKALGSFRNNADKVVKRLLGSKTKFVFDSRNRDRI